MPSFASAIGHLMMFGGNEHSSFTSSSADFELSKFCATAAMSSLRLPPTKSCSELRSPVKNPISGPRAVEGAPAAFGSTSVS